VNQIFPTPDYIVDAAAAATKVVANHRYSPTPGLPNLFVMRSLLKQSVIAIMKLPLTKF
jgi:aspartate/methionine/tyrosine aminotransferase